VCEWGCLASPKKYNEGALNISIEDGKSGIILHKNFAIDTLNYSRR